jgi:hypothetical protein
LAIKLTGITERLRTAGSFIILYHSASVEDAAKNRRMCPPAVTPSSFAFGGPQGHGALLGKTANLIRVWVRTVLAESVSLPKELSRLLS